MKPLASLARAALAAAATCWCATGAAVATAPQADASRGLGELSRRLQAGDLSAIDELLARTRPASIDLADANARAAALRAEIERLRTARAARPRPPPRQQPPADPAPEPSGVSIDPLREARAWLRAGDPTRCLRALRSDEGEAAYLRARALEQLGRDGEALEAYRRIAASGGDDALRQRAAAGLAHMEWRARIVRAREANP